MFTGTRSAARASVECGIMAAEGPSASEQASAAMAISKHHRKQTSADSSLSAPPASSSLLPPPPASSHLLQLPPTHLQLGSSLLLQRLPASTPWIIAPTEFEVLKYKFVLLILTHRQDLAANLKDENKKSKEEAAGKAEEEGEKGGCFAVPREDLGD